MTGQPLVDMVLDKAGQKGTGKWTVQAALELGIAVPTIGAALDARVLSSLKDERVAAAPMLQGPAARQSGTIGTTLLRDLPDALYASRICVYAQGLALISAASRVHDWRIDIAEVARIWKAGCIIRARLLDPLRHAFSSTPGSAERAARPRARAGGHGRAGSMAPSGEPRRRGRDPVAGTRHRAGLFRQLSVRAPASEPHPGAT